MKKKLLLISFILWLQTAKSIDEVHSTTSSKNKQAFFLISAVTGLSACICFIKTAWSIQQYLRLKNSVLINPRAHNRVTKIGDTLLVSLNGIDRELNDLLNSTCKSFSLSCCFAYISFIFLKKSRKKKSISDLRLDQNSGSVLYP